MFKLYSHPGKLLKDHLNNVYQLGMKKLNSKNLNFTAPEEIELLLKIILITHDFGKANEFFQRKLELKEKGKEDTIEFKRLNQQGKNKSNHSLLSAVFTYYLANTLFKDQILSLISLVIVLKHHGNLKDIRDMINISDWDLLQEQYETIDLEELQQILDLTDLNVVVNNLSFQDLKGKFTGHNFRRLKIRMDNLLTSEDNYLMTNLLYSILIFADKADAIFYNKGLDYRMLEELVLNRKDLPLTAVDYYRKRRGWEQPATKMDEKRNQIYREVINNIANLDLKKDRILSINVPTGTGKTLTSLAAGLRLRESLGQDYRLIYTLPFTSIIDQNFNEYKKVLSCSEKIIDSSLLIKHHYLTPKSYIKKNNLNEELYDDQEYDVSRHLIESWTSEIIVTTFVQLLHSLFSDQNRSLIKFNNIANSIILLDEVQSIPYKYWKFIRVMLNKIAEKMDCYFILITATMPLIYSEEKNEIKELAINKKEYFNFFDRIILDLSHFREEMTLDDFKSFIAEELEENPEKNVLIILNTIKSSTAIYQYINELVDCEREELIYLSTNIIPKDREDRINRIGDSDKRQIIVSTQMVEAGVDIDLDLVYRDFAPLDSINQTCGRCNRNFNPDKKGKVILVKLVNKEDKNNSYASYVYGDILRLKTEKLLNELPDIVEEKKFFMINKKYFKSINQAKADQTSDNLIKFVKKLKYETAFSHNPEGETFKIIEQDYETVNLFIELDDDAQKVWDKYQKINKMKINSPEDYSKRQSQFEKIKKEFLDYVITIPKNVAKKQLSDNQFENNFNYIDFYQVEDVYNQNTGFKRENTEASCFF